VGFFIPFSGQRYFFPWRPIKVAPLSIGEFFTRDGLAIFSTELVVVWIPALVLWAAAMAIRRRRSPPT
jgi:inner membrane protein